MITSKAGRMLIAGSGLAALIGLGLAPHGAPASAQTGIPRGFKPPPRGFRPPPRPQRRTHPRWHQALNQLQGVRATLQAAARDPAGHHDRALELTDQAIREMQMAIKSDRQ